MYSSKRTYVEMPFLWRKGNGGEDGAKGAEIHRTVFGDRTGSVVVIRSHYIYIYFYGQKFKIVPQGCSFC